MNAKTAQKHDYPSAAHRRSYARRTGAERGFATAKDPASNDISRGWCRLMGLAPLMLFTTTVLIVRNQRILNAWTARQEENQRRAAAGLPAKTRKRRRKTLASLATRHNPGPAAHGPGVRHQTHHHHPAGSISMHETRQETRSAPVQTLTARKAASTRKSRPECQRQT